MMLFNRDGAELMGVCVCVCVKSIRYQLRSEVVFVMLFNRIRTELMAKILKPRLKHHLKHQINDAVKLFV